MKIWFGSGMKIYNVSDGFGSANSNIKGINNGLSKILFHCSTSQATQIDTVEALLVPESHNQNQ